MNGSDELVQVAAAPSTMLGENIAASTPPAHPASSQTSSVYNVS